MIDFTSHRLENGMTLLHHYDRVTRMVAVNILYKVGSAHEQEPLTGLAHLLEHLMFGESEHAPSFDQALQRAGGESNAWTSVDATNYYDVLPAPNLDTALWLESDRLMGLTLSNDSIATQKSVVIEEFKQRCLNAPYGDMAHLVGQLA
ncbi:MAG: insulinase family protein, partial [Muribaculaceae bacterium]|nr:insulinase family protein [Muribaculaceae bacterium]